ncbi:MAG: hypothetical protein ABIH72_04145 [archaeon]
MNPEQYFFMYAFPCAYLKVELGQLSEEDYNELERQFKQGIIPTREELEKLFSSAFRRIKILAREMNKYYWDLDLIKKYWLEEHNKFIGDGEGTYKVMPESLKDLCRVHVAEIIKKKENLLVVKYGDSERVVFSDILKEVKVGDKVRIHFSYAVEKLD